MMWRHRFKQHGVSVGNTISANTELPQPELPGVMRVTPAGVTLVVVGEPTQVLIIKFIAIIQDPMKTWVFYVWIDLKQKYCVLHNIMITWNLLPDVFKVNFFFSMFKSKVRIFYVEKDYKIFILSATMMTFFSNMRPSTAFQM